MGYNMEIRPEGREWVSLRSKSQFCIADLWAAVPPVTRPCLGGRAPRLNSDPTGSTAWRFAFSPQQKRPIHQRRCGLSPLHRAPIVRSGAGRVQVRRYNEGENARTALFAP